MNALHIIAAAFVALGSCAATAKPVFAHRNSSVVSRSDATTMSLISDLGINLPGSHAGWYPKKIVTQQFDYEGTGWATTATTELAYDDNNRIASVGVSMPATGNVPVYIIGLGYETAKSVLPDTVTVNAFNSPAVQYHITYDEKVATYPVKIENRTRLADGYWSDWAVTLDVEVKRDADGRVTSVEPKLIKTDNLPLDYEKLDITYGPGNYPVAIKSYAAEPRSNGKVDFADMVSLTDMQFEACNNQILMLTDLYKAPNQLTSCHMTDDDGCDLAMSFSYGDRGSYVAEMKGIDDDGMSIASRLEMTYTDAYGSFTMSQTTNYTTTGYFEEEYESITYNEFGLIEAAETYEHSTDPSDGLETEESSIKGITHYLNGTGLPCEYVRSVKIEGTETFAPVMRQLFDGYEPESGIDVPTVTPAAIPSAEGIFTIEGRKLPTGTTLAPGFYIINGVKTLVR